MINVLILAIAVVTQMVWAASSSAANEIAGHFSDESRLVPTVTVDEDFWECTSTHAHTLAARSLNSLEHAGITVAPTYIGELFSNTRGGLSTKDATQYEALFDLALTIDLEQLGTCLPGTIFLLAQNTHGRGLTEDFTGDAQVLSNIDSGVNIALVGEYWWEFDLVADALTVRLGKQDVSTEFFFMVTAADFMHSSFGLTPASGLPTYPDQSISGVVLAQLTDALQFKLGVWDALAFRRGWGFSGNDTLFCAAELEWNYSLCDGTFPGTLTFGAGYATQGEIFGSLVDDTHGYTVQIEQLLWRECSVNNDLQGLGAFFAYAPRFFTGRTPTESIGDNFVGGLVYRGLLPNRDEDVSGIGVAWAELFQGGSEQETAVELFYKAQLTSRVSLQPAMQYIATPSGIYPDAVVAGLRFQVQL